MQKQIDAYTYQDTHTGYRVIMTFLFFFIENRFVMQSNWDPTPSSGHTRWKIDRSATR